jgi:uncharacterized protein (UPF0333 family)
MAKKNKAAQSMLEYIMVLTAIVGIIIFAAAYWIKPAVTTSLEFANSTIDKVADKFPQP